MERRIRALEEALDCFSGVEWIIKVGETAALKSVVLEDTPGGTLPPAPPPDEALAALDQQITRARGPGPLRARRAAFAEAQELLRDWLRPAMREPRLPGAFDG